MSSGERKKGDYTNDSFEFNENRGMWEELQV